jgi:cell division transport system permease protein
MLHFIGRAVKDIAGNRFLNAVAIITVALAVMIAGAFGLFFVNADGLLKFWVKGIRIMAYLKPGVTKEKISDIGKQIQRTAGVRDVRFISRQEAMERFRVQMKEQASLLENLKENPLPDAFEIGIAESFQKWENFEALAARIQTFPEVGEVEYGKKWLGLFINIFDLFRLAGYAMGCLFFIATVFFVANTIRLVLYSRREEIEIMRLVGASEGFIKDPFYIQSFIQGGLGSFIGLGILYIVFKFVIGDWQMAIGDWKADFLSDIRLPVSGFQIRFLPPEISLEILLGSMFAGWLGCYISLRQFLKL